MKKILVFTLIIAAAVMSGCASRGAAVSDSNEPRQIVDVIMQENSESLILSIRGNQKLIHMENKQTDPKKIELFFPATGLDGVRGHFVPPDNEIISSIVTNEHIKNASRIACRTRQKNRCSSRSGGTREGQEGTPQYHGCTGQ